MSRLRKLAPLFFLFLLTAVVLPVFSSTNSVAGAASASGLGQLDQGFGAPSGTSGVRSGIAQSSGLACTTGTSGLAYATDSGVLTGIAAVGTEESASGSCSSTATTGIAALFSNSGVNLWTNENVFSALNSVKVLPGSSGAIVAVGKSASEPVIVLLSQAKGSELSDRTVAVSSGLIPSQGSFSSLAVGPQTKIQSSSGSVINVDPVYAVGSITSSNGTELLMAAYGVENPDSSSATLIPINGFGNQGSTSNLYIASMSQPGVNIKDVALGSSGNIYVTGNAQDAISGCSSNSQLGFVLDYQTQSTVSAGVYTYSGTNPNNTFGAGGMYWFKPVALPSGQTFTCFDTSLNYVLVDAGTSSGSIPPSILLGGYERTANSATVNSSVGVLAGLNIDATPDKAFGSSGTVLAAGGTNSLNEINSVAYIPTPGQSAGSPAGIIVSGTNYQNADGSSNYELGVSHYSLTGVLDTTFGNDGVSLIPGCTSPDSTCGQEVGVQPDGSINLVGQLNISYKGLSVAQLTDREVELATTTPNVSVSASQTPSADFTVTVSAPGNSGLVGIPGGVVANFTTVNGTGKGGYNYQSSSGKVVFPCNASEESIAGGSITCNSNLSATIAIPTIYPSNATGSASFSLQITSVKNAGTAFSSAAVNITYPPPPPVTTTVATPTTTVVTPTTTVSNTTTTYSPAPVTTTTLIKAAKTIVPGQGYLVVTANGQILPYGDTASLGSIRSLHPKGQIIAMKATPGNKGYWAVSSAGFVYTFGNAHNYGEPASLKKKKKMSGLIVGFATTANEKGYWLLSSTGVVYTFGNAHNYGQLFHKRYVGRLVDLFSATTNNGYWIITSEGRVYPFGRVRNYGFVKPKTLHGTITGGAVSSANKGYWLLSSTGVVYTFGNAHNYGYYGHTYVKAKSKSSKKTIKTITKKMISMTLSAAVRERADFAPDVNKNNSRDQLKKKSTHTKNTTKTKKIIKTYFVAIEPTINYKGYWILSSVGNIFHFGDAKFYGSPAAKHLKNIKDIVIVP